VTRTFAPYLFRQLASALLGCLVFIVVFCCSFGLGFGGVAAGPLLHSFSSFLNETGLLAGVCANLYLNPPFTFLDSTLPSRQSSRRYAALPMPPYTCSIDVSYNNVFLINAVNLVVIGEALQDLGYGPNAAAAAASGYMLLDSWFEYSFVNGIAVTGGRRIRALIGRLTFQQASMSTLRPLTVGSNCRQCTRRAWVLQ
jgi:hypothetical protein